MSVNERASGMADPGKIAAALVELPRPRDNAGVELRGPPGAQTVMLIHGVAGTAELNWARVFAPLSRHFRVIAQPARAR